MLTRPYVACHQVTTLLSKAEEVGAVGLTDEQVAELDQQVSQQGSAVKAAKEVSSALPALSQWNSRRLCSFAFDIVAVAQAGH